MSDPKEPPPPVGEPPARSPPPHPIDPPPVEPPDGESPGAPPSREPASQERPRQNAVVALAVALLVVVIMVLVAPFWAPALIPLLPWGGGAQPQADVAPRLDAIDQARAQEAQRLAAIGNTVQQLDKRVAGVEAKSSTSPNDLADLRQQVAKLPNDIADLRQQIARLPTVSPNDIADLRQQLVKLTDANTALGNRLGIVEKAVQAEQASDQTDTALVLSLLQMRDAVEAGRPFQAEYDTFATLARSRPELADAAAPLADPAKTGVPSRQVLIQRLTQLAGTITNAGAGANAASDWRQQTLSRLSSLVTVRRIGGTAQSGPEAAVSEAQKLVAQGDLAAAIARIGKLTGPSAGAAAPWLAMARTRLAAETALHQTEMRLTARLGGASAPAQSGARP